MPLSHLKPKPRAPKIGPKRMSNLMKMVDEASKLLRQTKAAIRQKQKELGFGPGEGLAFLEEQAKSDPHAKQQLEEHFARQHHQDHSHSTSGNAAARQFFQESEDPQKGFRVKNWARL